MLFLNHQETVLQLSYSGKTKVDAEIGSVSSQGDGDCQRDWGFSPLESPSWYDWQLIRRPDFLETRIPPSPRQARKKV
jgi:hypothetical protein